MTQVRLSASLPESLVQLMKDWAQAHNISQSAVLKSALEDWLQHRLGQEAEVLAAMNFADIPTEADWEDLQSETKF